MKNKTNYIQIITIILVILVLSYSTFAWFSDRSNPTISESELKVTTGEGLRIKTSQIAPAQLSVNLFDIISDPANFRLKQVSSQDGINFFRIDFGQGLAYQNPTFSPVIYNNNILDMMEYGYIDHDFFLVTESYGKSVYLHKDTSFSGLASNAMRLAISINDQNNNIRMIFGNQAENGITDPYTTHAVYNSGSFVYGYNDPLLVGNQIVFKFSEKDGGRGSSDEAPINPAKILLNIPANSSVKVNIKVWLEGGDIDCDNTIASSYLDTVIKFGSANILLPAPELHATAQRRLTGLDTTMEYYVGTDLLNAVWIPVTDPLMTFAAGSTVNVRIKEVPNVSLASYIKTVKF